MGWNHRVCKRTYNKGELHEETFYEIHECFYDKGEPVDGKPWGIGVRSRAGGPDVGHEDGENPIPPGAESPEGLRILLDRMLRALDKPVIDFETRERV